MPQPSDPSFDLVAACCRRPDGDDARAAIQRHSTAADWARVAALAGRHRVWGLVWDGLGRAGVEPPEPHAGLLRTEARAAAVDSLRLAAESARLQAGLGQSGIPCLVLKGAAVEKLAYGRLGLKSAWDIDLLVAPERVADALRALKTDGYVVTSPVGLSPRGFDVWIGLAKECELTHPDTDVVVELHWRLTDGPSLLPGLGVGGSSQVVEPAPGLRLETFATEALFAYMCVHGAMHAWGRLKWLADLSALAAQLTPEELERLWLRSVELGAGHCGAQALLLSHDLLGLPLDPAFERRLRGPATVRWLVAAARKTLAEGGVREIEDRAFAHTRILLSQFALGGSVAHAWQELRYRLISVEDRARMPLPPAFGFVYPLLRFPMWAARRLGLSRKPAAIRAVSDATNT